MNNKGEGPGKGWTIDGTTVAYHLVSSNMACWNTPIELNEFNFPIYYLHLVRGFPSGLPSLMTPSRVPLEGYAGRPRSGSQCIQETYEPRSARPHDPSPANAVEQSLSTGILSNIWEGEKKRRHSILPLPCQEKSQTLSLSLHRLLEEFS